jgi:flagellin-like protein
MKGISPIIASVLLIAITMSIAVILAAYVTSYTRTATESIPSACIGGALFVHGTPTCSAGTLTITIEANYVTLTDFKADTRDSTGTILDSAVARASGPSSLASGEIGTLTFSTTCTNVDEVRVTTNCFNVRSDWTTASVS